MFVSTLNICLLRIFSFRIFCCLTFVRMGETLQPERPNMHTHTNGSKFSLARCILTVHTNILQPWIGALIIIYYVSGAGGLPNN